MSSLRRRNNSEVLVNLFAILLTVTFSDGLNLHSKTERAICESLCGAETVIRGNSNCSCDTLLANALSNNTLELEQDLFCKNDDILALKIRHHANINKLDYIVERRNKDSNWEFAAKGILPESPIFSVPMLKSNTSYKVRTWIIDDNGSMYLPMETEWLNTSALNVMPLPVKELESHYIFTKNSSHAEIKWIPGDDLSCYYLLRYDNGVDQDYFYINEPKNLFTYKIGDIKYKKTYNIVIKARNSIDLESDERNVTMKTPACLDLYSDLSICPPDPPCNLTVEEIPNSENSSSYDLKISWAKPKYIPDLYAIYFSSLSGNITKNLNISGESTNLIISQVKSQDIYYVTVRALSEGGESEPITYDGLVEGISSKSSNLPITWILIGLFLILCFCTVSSIFINYRIEKKRRAYKRKQYFKDLEQKCPPSDSRMMYQYEMQEHLGDEWEIDPKDVTFHKVLGRGAFGVVRFGLLMKGKIQTEVAVKTLKSFPTAEEMGHFQHELEIMKSVGAHPHLVSLIGVCIKENYGPILVVEYCSKGDLQNYLKSIWEKIMSASVYQNDTGVDANAGEFANKLYDMAPINICDNELITSKDLLSFARQIAKGMEYLAKLKILHRDLATRNVLVCEDKTVKVSDFGLSRDVYQNNMYCKKAGGKLPIRWLAIESLTHQQYTTQSDVWSFGILLWEIVTLGGDPYPGIPTENLLPLLKSGYRMENPINCKQEIYDIMLNCWKANPKDRLTFTEIGSSIDNLLESAREYLQVDVNTCVEMNSVQINTYKNVQNQRTLFERYVKPIWR